VTELEPSELREIELSFVASVVTGEQALWRAFTRTLCASTAS
jgi:hypothetical protein